MVNKRNQIDIQAFKKSINLNVEREASEKELQSYKKAAELVKKIQFKNPYQPQNPNHCLFVAAFDGTGKDRSNKKQKRTNIGLLEHWIGKANAKKDTVASLYLPGVATGDIALSKRVFESVTGDGSIDRAEQAFHELEQHVKHWRSQNKQCQVHVITLGFSRGTGSQRHFANLIAQNQGAQKEAHKQSDTDSDNGKIQQDLMLLLDSVITGQEEELQTDIPFEVKKVVHFLAGNENRVKLDLASVIDPYYPEDEDIYELQLPGSHTDIGGQYDYDEGSTVNGLSVRTLAIAYKLLAQAGVGLADKPKRYKVKLNQQSIQNTSLFGLHNIEFGQREIWHPGNPRRRINKSIEQTDTEFEYTRSDGVTLRYDPTHNISKLVD